MIDKSPIIAAMDLGTNSFHLVIASVNSRGMLQTITREKEVVRLGNSGKDMKYLLQDAIDRGVEAVKNFTKLAKSNKAEIVAVATSAVREAVNKQAFTNRVKEETGVEISIVSGNEEGRLIYLGALHALPIFNKKTLLIDIGGGSTETVVGYRGEISYVHSEKLGAIRMTKQFFPDPKITKEQINKCREFIRGEWTPVLKRVKEQNFEYCVGTAGTIQNVVSMALVDEGNEIPEINNGVSVSGKQLLQMIDKIVNAKTLEERILLPGIDPGRADIIVGGALILEYALQFLNIKQLVISSYALREGIVFDWLSKKTSIKDFHHLSYLRYQTIVSLSNKFDIFQEHSESVRQITLSIFDDLQKIHKLGWEQRELLEAAAILHDIGYYISHDQHHKHSYYIIKNCIMPGFTNDEADLIANIARYHRKSHPKKKHENFARLSPENQKNIKILSGILRIAEGIDRRQMQIIREVRTKVNDNKIIITMFPDPKKIAPDIELWGANRRKSLLEEVIGMEIEFCIAEI